MAITVQQAAGYLNETLGKLGYDYRIDTTSDATLEAGFKEVGAFSPLMLDNIVSMQMKILRNLVYTSMFTESKNPMRRFFRDAVDYGGGIQETYLKLIKAEDGYWAHSDMTDIEADEIAKDLVKFKDDDVINKIHPVNFKFRIKMSVSELEISKLFTPAGYASFIGQKYANFQQSAEAKLMEIGINMIKKMVSDGKCKFETGLDLSNPNGVTSTVERINTVSDGMQTLNALYNYDAVDTTTEFDNLYLVVTPKFINRLRSRGYSNAFNLEEYRAKNRLIMLPAGTVIGTDSTGKEIGCMLIDYRSVLIAIKYWEVKPFIVSNTDYRNMFMNVQGIVDYNEFFNAVAFVTGDVDFFTSSDAVVNVTLGGSMGDGTTKYKVNGNPISQYYTGSYAADAYHYADLPVGGVLEVSFDETNAAYTNSLHLQGNTTITLSNDTGLLVKSIVITPNWISIDTH